MKQSTSSHISHQFSAQVSQPTLFGIKSYCTELQSHASHAHTSTPPEEQRSGVTPFLVICHNCCVNKESLPKVEVGST